MSTKSQGRSGLDLGDQRTIVGRYLRDDDQLLVEYTEIESGRKSGRPMLQQAIRTWQQQGVKLLIAKLDRLSRNIAFVMTLRDSGVDFVACDLPDANTLTVGMMVTFAQYETERTSERTRAALAQKKAQIYQLGTPANLDRDAIRKGETIRRHNALHHKSNVQATQLAYLYRSQGQTYARIAELLNQTRYQIRRQKLFNSKAVFGLLQRQQAASGS